MAGFLQPSVPCLQCRCSCLILILSSFLGYGCCLLASGQEKALLWDSDMSKKYRKGYSSSSRGDWNVTSSRGAWNVLTYDLCHVKTLWYYVKSLSCEQAIVRSILFTWPVQKSAASIWCTQPFTEPIRITASWKFLHRKKLEHRNVNIRKVKLYILMSFVYNKKASRISQAFLWGSRSQRLKMSCVKVKPADVVDLCIQ